MFTTNQITSALVAYRSAADQDTATASSSVVLATHTAGVSVDGYTLTLAANPWNIVRTYNLTPGQELLFACRYRLGTASNFVVYMSEADNVYDPLYGSFVGDQGAWSTAKMYFTVPPNGVAKLHFGAHFQAPGLPNQTAGTVDVYGLQILDATLETGNTAEVEEDTAASALLLKHEFLDGGADDVTLATLGDLGQLCGGRLPAGGLRHDPERLCLEHRAHLHADAGETLLLRLPVPAGARLRGRHRHLPRHALAGRLEHGAPGLLGAAGRIREAALRSLRRVYPRAGAAVGGHAGPVQHADQGQRLPGRVCLSNGPAGGLAGPHGLGHAGRAHHVGCDQLLCNDVNCTDVFTTGVDALGAVSCAALTATGTVAGATLTSTGAVSGSSLSISGAASVGLLSSATGITGSTLTINITTRPTPGTSPRWLCRPPCVQGTLLKLLFGATSRKKTVFRPASREP